MYYIKRLVACIVDCTICGLCLLPLYLYLDILSMLYDNNTFIIMMALLVPIIAYYIIFEVFTGNTPGKRLVRLGYINEKFYSKKITWYQSLIRNITRFLDHFGLGIILIILTRKQQRLGDMIAGSRVVELTTSNNGEKK